MKTIYTLIKDIHDVLDGNNVLDGLPKDLARQFGERMSQMVSSRVLSNVDRVPRLSPSNIGKPCERQVWYSVNTPELTEKLSPEARLKFLYGDMIEELLLFLAEASGHRVEGRQDVVEIEGIKGSRDAIIDGVLVDVKSASTYSFAKFRDGKLAEDDPFGYIGQIQTYLEASQDDLLVTEKNICAFFVMDKTLGHICLDIHEKVPFDVREITRRKVQMVNSKEIPERRYEPIPEGKSGNMKLPMECSYCNMKKACHPSVRTFIYSKGPVYLTEVVKVPDVLEVTNE